MGENKCKYYGFGYSGYDYLSVDDSVYTQSELLSNGTIREIQCDINEKWMKVRTNCEDSEDWVEMDFDGLNKGITIDLSEQGERWEGDSLNGVPFGYGCIYNSNNQLIYKGFIFEGMKVCFGSVFYEDVGIVEYVGGFYKNNRYGCGELFDKKNELIYEGEWINDKPMEERSVIIKEELKEEDIHYGLEEIVIQDYCNCKLNFIELVGFDHLKKLEIGSNSLEYVEELILRNLPYLEVFKTCYRALFRVSNLVLESTFKR